MTGYLIIGGTCALLAVMLRWLAWYSTRWDSNNSSEWLGWSGVIRRGKDSTVQAYRRQTREHAFQNARRIEQLRATTKAETQTEAPVIRVETNG